MRDWINLRYGTNFTEDDLKSVKDFTLMWNIFDSVTCSTHFSIVRFEQILINQNYDINRFLPFLNYFKERYVVNNEFNNRFQHLNFRNNDRKDLVKEVLLGNNINEKEIILALIIIIFRFRNNLFHGVKDIQVIDEQRSNFENANEILKIIMENF